MGSALETIAATATIIVGVANPFIAIVRWLGL